MLADRKQAQQNTYTTIVRDEVQASVTTVIQCNMQVDGIHGLDGEYPTLTIQMVAIQCLNSD